MTTSNNTLNRNKTIDVAKGLGMLLVIFAHINHMHPIWSIIYSFHMPLFFVIAGMNFHPEKYKTIKELIKRKYHTMIKPYLFFCLFGVVWFLLRNLYYDTQLKEIACNLAKIAFAIIWAPSSEPFQSFNTPLWFVPCLLLVEILFYWLSKNKNKPAFWISIILITTAGWFMESDFAPWDFSMLPWNFSSACFVMGFFVIGNSMRAIVYKQIIEPELNKHQIIKLLLLFVLAFLITVYVGAHTAVSIGSRELGNGFVLIITGLTGTLCVLIGARIMEKVKFFNFFGRNSFAVMGFHIPLFWCLCTILIELNKANPNIPTYNSENILITGELFVAVTALTGLLTLAYNKLKPDKTKQ